MKKNYISIVVAMTIAMCQFIGAQEAQKNFINYQGVARNAENQLMASEAMTVNIALKFGAAASAAIYEESHSLMTDANGVFSLLIGNGSAMTGNYNTLPWGSAATFVTVSIDGKEIGTTELMAVPYALSAGNIKDPSADEVLYDNAISGLAATTTQDAIDELVNGGSVDADADPFNELQTISFNASTNELSLTDGGSVIIPSGGTDADADPENELQTLSFDAGTSELSLTDGGTVTLPSGGTDADADPGNELQNLSLSGTTLNISDGTGVDLAPIIPPGGTDDQTANEVPYDNTTSGLTATDAQAAIDELASGGLVDTDNQDLSLSGTTLNISDGTGVDLAPIIPPGGTDDQNLILIGDVLSIENGNGSVDLSTYAGDDADADPTNEIDVTTENGLLMGDGAVITGLVGTADGQVAKWDATTGSWQADTDAIGEGGSALWSENGDRIYFNDGNVGIGTDSPSSRLEITSASAELLTIEPTNSGGDGWIRFNNDTGRVGYAGMFNGNRDMELGTSGDNPTGKVHLTIGGSPSLTVASNGNVGIGTTEPESGLHVNGRARVDEGVLVGTNTTSRALELGNPGGLNRWRLRTIDANRGLLFESQINNGGVTSRNGRFIMESTGEFKFGGFGGNPEAWLHVIKNSTVGKPHLKIEETGDDYARLELTNDRTSSFWHVAGLPANNAVNGRLNFYFRNAGGGGNRMSITGDGKVGINGIPQARLHIFQRGVGANDGLRFSDGTTNPDWDIIHANQLTFRHGGDIKAYIDRNTGAYFQLSDRRLKTDIHTLGPVLDKVNQLQPSTYRYKSDSSNKNTIGLIAQEVESLFPELVNGLGEDGMLSLDYGAFSVIAIKAIQEQQKTIVEQSKQIEDLERRLRKIETRLDE